MNKLRSNIFPLKEQLSLVALILMFSFVLFISRYIADSFIELVLIDLFAISMIGLGVYYNFLRKFKSRKLFVQVEEGGILINHANDEKNFLKWENIETMNTQGIVEYLKPIPEVHVYLSLKIKDGVVYNRDIPNDKLFIRNPSDFNKYIGDKSSDIYINLKIFKNDDLSKLFEILKKHGLKESAIKPLIKTNDKAVYEKISNRYFVS